MAVESYEKLMGDLKKLRLPAMTEMLDSYVKQAASSSMSYMDFLSGLVSEEVRYKEQRAVQSRIKSARFPVLKSLDDFDYVFQPSINRKKLAELSSLRFIDNRENILFLGPLGSGNPNQEKAYLGSTVFTGECVTIVDPRHPLFGRTLPLVHITNKQNQGRCCVVLLQEGIERIVPLQATDRSPEPIQEFPLPIDLSSVKQLSEVCQRILRMHGRSVETSMEESEDGYIQGIHTFPEGDNYSHTAATTKSQGDLGVAQQCAETDTLSHGSSDMPQHRCIDSSRGGIEGEES